MLVYIFNVYSLHGTVLDSFGFYKNAEKVKMFNRGLQH